MIILPLKPFNRSSRASPKIQPCASFVSSHEGLRGSVQSSHAWPAPSTAHNWVAVKERKLSYHNPETILITIYPYHGTLN